jgi:hypothetical protein
LFRPGKTDEKAKNVWKEEDEHEDYDHISTSMLTVSTFASAITFNIILKPSGSNPPAQALLYLSYANSLFCGAIMGCVLIKVTIELCKATLDYVDQWKKEAEEPVPAQKFLYWLYFTLDSSDTMESIAHWLLGLETMVVLAILFVALFLLLLSCKFFLQINGPFIAGTIIYGFFGLLVILFVAIGMIVGHAMRSQVRKKKGKGGSGTSITEGVGVGNKEQESSGGNIGHCEGKTV